jgi:heat shock protein HslJ
MSEVPDVSSTAAETGTGSEPGGRRPVLLAALGVALLVIVGLLVWAVAGGDDDGDDVSSGGTEDATALWGTTWRILTITEGGQDTTPDLPAGKDLLDASTEDQISFTGCNGGSGGASLEGDVLVVDDMMQTQMACADEDGQILMDHDTFMVGFLTARPTVAIDGDQLTLTTDDATVTLEAISSGSGAGGSTTVAGDPDEPVSSEPAFWGSTWTITRLVDDGTELDVVDAQASGTAPELDTTAEGTISFTGCNGGRGEANYGAGKLAVGPLASTKMACEDAALMTQDEFISSLLTAVPSVSVEGDTLILTVDQDQLVATRQS